MGGPGRNDFIDFKCWLVMRRMKDRIHAGRGIEKFNVLESS